jgi:hypothetical protein
VSVVAFLAGLSVAGYAWVIITVLRRRAAQRRREEFVAPPVPRSRVAAATTVRLSQSQIERIGGARAKLLDALDAPVSTPLSEPGPLPEAAAEPSDNVITLGADRARNATR